MDVIFPVMPFADAGRPSMGVSLLAAEVEAAGYSAEILYFNLDLASEMGLATYQRVASSFLPNMLLGEWIFADDVFVAEIPGPDEYLADIFIPFAGNDKEMIDAMLEVRRRRTAYLDACVAEIMVQEPRVVGFTTVFHQTCACLAIARRLKVLQHPPVIVFGGANCEGEMGLQMIRSFPWIDFVCSGESDVSFPQLMDRLSGKTSYAPIAGVLERGVAEEVASSMAVLDLNGLPYPNFDGYFNRLAASGLVGQFESHLVFETSRGCWWGAKHHCTFCGLNGDTMVFRSKSPDRAFEEIEYLTRRHGARHVGCVDNILDMKYVTTLFPRLAEAGLDLELFYEVKSNLSHEQLKLMRTGGISQIQPGIESFSDAVLTLMEKGCTGFQNIRLLRWCKELGIEVSWNILAGFPQEDPTEYAAMAKLIPRLTHLDPPCSTGKVRLDRFSPFHTRSEEFGFIRMRPARAYFYVFPLGRRELNRLAYFFDFDYENGHDPQEYIMPVQRECQRWLAECAATDRIVPSLDAEFDDDRLTICDTRAIATASRHEFDGLASHVYACCDAITTVERLAREFAVQKHEIETIIDDFDRRHLVARKDNHVMSLAVFRVRPMIDKTRTTSSLTHHAEIPVSTIA